MKWYACLAVRPAPGWTYHNIKPRWCVSDGKVEFVYRNHPLAGFMARLKAWRLNRAATLTIEDVKVERLRFEKAMREIGG